MLKAESKDKDNLICRCPRLGGPVSFGYCKKSGDEGRPCWKIFDCWWEYFDIVTYLKKELSSDEFNSLVKAKAKPKINSLIDLIEQARKRKD